MSNRSFVTGIAVCLALMIAVGFGINALNRGHSRPEGVAEDWLTALGDTAREGVEADATKRAEKIGPITTEEMIAGGVLIVQDTNGKSAFADLEVGKAVGADTDDAVVRFGVNARRGDDLTQIEGVLVMKRVLGEWQVFGAFPTKIGDRKIGTRSGEDVLPKLPSNGGPPPSSASATLWLIALAGGVAVTAAASGLVHWAGRQPGVAPAG